MTSQPRAAEPSARSKRASGAPAAGMSPETVAPADTTAAADTGAAPDTGTTPSAWALGPGSVTWTVMRDPAVFLVGLLREAILLTLHPPFAAAAVDHDSFLDDPVMRFRRVAVYTYTATYGTPVDAERVSAMVRRRHIEISGVEPLAAQPYRAHSEYELALTQTMLAASFLTVHELLHGRMTTAKRNQFLQEQKVPAALLGVRPEHMPSTWGAMQEFLARARDGFSTGYQAREIIAPFSRGSYPAGSALGDLPAPQRAAAMWAIRAMADMALLTMDEEERALVSIDRRPKLGSDAAVLLSLKLLSRYLRSRRGSELFLSFVKANTAKIMRRAFEVDDKRGKRNRSNAFRVPDAAALLVELPDLVRNWPWSEPDGRTPATLHHVADPAPGASHGLEKRAV